MKLATVALFAVLAACGSGDIDGADGGITAADAMTPLVPGPQWVGRVELTATGARMGWSGTGVIIRFRGTAARATLDTTAGYYTVVVDGVVQPRLDVTGGPGEYTLAESLSDAEHTVELYRRTEGSFGVSEITDIQVDGELLGVPPPTRRIEILGDSITCGYGNEGADAFCNFSADTENHYMTYGAMAARTVGAQLSTVAWSGKGVIFNYGDDTSQPLPTLYERTVATEPGAYDFPSPADVVVINLGTNDFSTDNDPSEEQFVPAYVALLENVRAHHPNALILPTLAPGLGGSDETTALTYIDSAITQRNNDGDAMVRFADLRTASTGFGCDYHPSIATHEAMASLLVSVLQTELGW
jgi:lysophospholipase L1-like esterase